MTFLLCLALSASAQDTAGITFTEIAPEPMKVIQPNNQTLTQLFLSGLLGGLAALLMPCIFPMLPLTVGFFTKRQQNRRQGIRDALLYGLAIVLIYVGLGMLITIAFGASALNELATNGVFNLCFFILLVVFAASFLGAFELTLPSCWVNKAEDNSDKKGFFGILMMAAVLALVSFSCTGPIIGTLLVQAATTGEHLGPAIGMLGFSIALALPFVVFALFPSLLNKLPRSGGWMMSFRISLGFLELALALKFLSNVDLAYHWNLLDREVFLSLWIFIFGCLTVFLLGKMKLRSDVSEESIGVPRLFTGIVVGAFTLYMIPGLWGAPLKAVSAFLPPQESQDFDLYSSHSGGITRQAGKLGRKYENIFHAPLNLPAFFDYEEGMAYARKVNKPVLIDFTGHACVNCRKMEAAVWSDAKVLPLIRDQYVLIQLYVDDKTAIPGGGTIGKHNSELQVKKFNSNSQPFYVLLSPEGDLMAQPIGAEYDPAQYADYLKQGL